MTKEELSWIIIRTIGFVFIVLTIIAIPDLLSSFYWAYYLFDAANFPISDGSQNNIRLMESGMVKTIIYGVTRFILMSLSAWYFLARDKFAFRLLTRGPSV